jgi:hypothetical protein
MRTFLVTWPDGENEEFDVHAETGKEGIQEVKRQLKEDYIPGWESIEEIAPGGSGGLITSWSL